MWAALALVFVGCAGRTSGAPPPAPVLRLVVSGATAGEIETCP